MRTAELTRNHSLLERGGHFHLFFSPTQPSRPWNKHLKTRWWPKALKKKKKRFCSFCSWRGRTFIIEDSREGKYLAFSPFDLIIFLANTNNNAFRELVRTKAWEVITGEAFFYGKISWKRIIQKMVNEILGKHFWDEWHFGFFEVFFWLTLFIEGSHKKYK